MFCVPILHHSTYEITALQMRNWPNNGLFCTFDSYLTLILALFARLARSNIYPASQGRWLVLVCLHTHPVSPFLKLQHLKCEICFKMDGFVLLTLICPSAWTTCTIDGPRGDPFCMLLEERGGTTPSEIILPNTLWPYNFYPVVTEIFHRQKINFVRIGYIFLKLWGFEGLFQPKHAKFSNIFNVNLIGVKWENTSKFIKESWFAVK